MDISPRSRIPKTFGRRVRAARLRARLTQEQLGERVGADKTTICRIEAGEAQLGSAAARAAKIAAALGIELSSLLA